MRLVREQQIDALPITMINGIIIKSNSYPSLAEVETALVRGA